MRYNVLVIFHGNLYEPQVGSEVRAHHLTKQAAQYHNICTLEYDEYEETTASFDLKQRYFFESSPIPPGINARLLDIDPRFGNKISSIVDRENIDIIHKHYPYGLKSISKAVNLSSTKMIYDSHDFETARMTSLMWDKLRRGRLLAGSWNCLNYAFARYNESRLDRLVDHVIAVSEHEKGRLITNMKSDDKVSVIPSGTTLRTKNGEQQEDGLSILFHGTYGYEPNRTAFQYIIDELAPKFQESMPNVEFLLAGKGVPENKTKNIRSLGFVENLGELLDRADIGIVPIVGGGGTNLKLLDYLGAGLPVVVTPQAAEGLRIRDEEHVLIAERGVRFAGALEDLVDNTELRIEIGKNAKKIAQIEYSWQSMGEKVDSLYNRVGER